MQQIYFTTEKIMLTMDYEKHFINSIYYQFEQTAKYCKSLGAQLFQKLNMPLSLDEFAALDTILIHGEICQRDLAKLILKDRPSTGRILNSLEDKGLIKRFADTKNNRLVRKTALTDDGKKLLEETSYILKKYFDNVSNVFPEQKVQKLYEDICKFRKCLEKEVEMKI